MTAAVAVEASSRRALEAIADGAPNDRALAVDALHKSLDLVEELLSEDAGESEAVS